MNMSKQWYAVTFVMAFATYWMVNLLLWYPWSISSNLGITLMLTASPVLWGYVIYKCLKKYRGRSLIRGALWVSFIFISVAVVGDYLFFGIIRNAMSALYEPTTFYGYAFLFSLPYLIAFIFQKKLKQTETIGRSDYLIFGMIALISILALLVIIRFNLTL